MFDKLGFVVDEEEDVLVAENRSWEDRSLLVRVPGISNSDVLWFVEILELFSLLIIAKSSTFCRFSSWASDAWREIGIIYLWMPITGLEAASTRSLAQRIC